MTDMIDMTPQQATPRTYRPPQYGEIVSGANVLRVIGSIIVGLGVLSLLGGIVWLCYAMVSINSNHSDLHQVLASPEYDLSRAMSFSCIISGLCFIASGCVLRMIGQVALAVRDIARNSFR